MKRTILTVFASAVFVALNAQYVVFSGEINNLQGSVFNASDEEMDTGWIVINPSLNTINVKMKTQALQLVTGSQYQFCWGALCSAWLSGNGSLPDVVSIGPDGADDSFHMKFRHYNNMGCSILRFIWYDANDESNMVAYDVAIGVDAKGCEVSVKEVTPPKANLASITPNPVVNTSYISYEFSSVPTDGKIQIHNMVGELVKEIVINRKSGHLVIEAADFDSGIYFCSIQSDGKIFETKRMVVTK